LGLGGEANPQRQEELKDQSGPFQIGLFALLV